MLAESWVLTGADDAIDPTGRRRRGGGGNLLKLSFKNFFKQLSFSVILYESPEYHIVV